MPKQGLKPQSLALKIIALLHEPSCRKSSQNPQNSVNVGKLFPIKERLHILKGPYTWSKKDTNMSPFYKEMSLGSWFCPKTLGNLFDMGTFIWDGGSFIWQGGTFIWQGGTFICRSVKIVLLIIRGTKFWSCLRTLNKLRFLLLI